MEIFDNFHEDSNIMKWKKVMTANKKTTQQNGWFFPAERVGFEPTVPRGTHALQARALGRTMLPLHIQ